LAEVPKAPLATEALPLSVDIEVLAILEEIAREAAEAEAEANGETPEIALGEVTEQP
jgi:hypothetical protein